MADRPRITGFCNPSHPIGGYPGGYNPHDRCRPTDDMSCSCVCHQPQTATDEPAEPLAPVPAGRTPGFYDDIPEEDYHRDPTSLSHSGAKTLLKAPALFRHEQQHPVIKHEFDFGHAAHSAVLGVGADIAVLDFDDRRTKAFKEAEAASRAAGQVPLLKKDHAIVQAMAEELSKHRLAMELLFDGRPEVAAYAPDERTGVMRRCRFDWLGSTILTDYKSADSSDPATFRRRVAEFGYHQQAPWYLDLARDLGHPAEAFAFIVQMKKPPFLVSVVELVPRAVDRGRELNDRALEIYRDCTTSGRWPGYVRDDAFAAIDLPAWAYTDHDDLEVPA